ncbi:MAG: hypothetical protein PHR20_00320 [Bacteroidales bacterium]|nr:hypothetical protein [Bacteroidales bacterium]
MATEDKRDFNAMLKNSKDMPKITEIKDEKGIQKWGGKTLVIAPPLDYDKYMKTVPEGKLITTNELRKKIAADYKVDLCCPLTCGIFVQIAAWASYQRETDETPFWRTLKSGGELNPKYPEAFDLQKKKLEKEGHIIIEKGKTNKRYFVKDFEKDIFELK